MFLAAPDPVGPQPTNAVYDQEHKHNGNHRQDNPGISLFHWSVPLF